MPQPWIYLDHAASSPLRPDVFEAMRHWLVEEPSSASSLHRGSLWVRDALDEARHHVATFLGAERDDTVAFTGSGTEAANLAILGYAEANRERGTHLISTVLEHPAVSMALDALETRGFRVTRVGCDSAGRIDPQAIAAVIEPGTILIATHLSNYDIGTIQPLAEIIRLANEREIPVFADGNHALGWVPCDVASLGLALFCGSPHRCGGPKGVGILYKQPGLKLQPQILGGTQESNLRAGTENIPAIIGASVALKGAAADFSERVARVAGLRDTLWKNLSTSVSDLVLNGPEPGPLRHPGHLSFSVSGIDGEALALLSDLNGIGFSAGTMCASRALKVSPVLKAIGQDHKLALGSVLLSLGSTTTTAEIETVSATLPKLITKLRSMN
jgi:cysteine desulfurase